MSQPRDQLLRTAGLGDFGTPQLQDVNRRRAQLWMLSLLVFLCVPAIIVASGLELLPDSVSSVLNQRTVQLGFVALLVALFGYVAEREVALRKLTGRLFDELAAHESMQATIEAMCELDDLKDDFLAMISHELRSPLTSIIGVLATLERSAHELDGDHLRELVQSAWRQSLRLDRLVDDLVESASLQQGASSLAASEVDVAAAVRETVAPLARDADGHTVTLQVPDDGVTCHVDRGALNRIIVNVVGRTLKHTPPGTEVHVTAEVVDRGLQITVTDDGSAIAPERQLGLHIVRNVSEAHGGDLHLDADAPGTRVTVRLAELSEHAATPA
jgi:signal transduction histidine kinase